ncbi:unnamed protein product [Polarella glacialis]|uniref:Uncharacterized protein n=1 Tax=Polarella glacialis TaxID=89957 RepID=A0A813IA36_POLGL|nr:unnamed protein product [Polarella glacialis]CAE8735067.1 unnamed protein product [Polarella glacialis]
MDDNVVGILMLRKNVHWQGLLYCARRATWRSAKRLRDRICEIPPESKADAGYGNHYDTEPRSNHFCQRHWNHFAGYAREDLCPLAISGITTSCRQGIFAQRYEGGAHWEVPESSE